MLFWGIGDCLKCIQLSRKIYTIFGDLTFINSSTYLNYTNSNKPRKWEEKLIVHLKLQGSSNPVLESLFLGFLKEVFFYILMLPVLYST